MAHILIISRYYPPEIGVAGVCVAETATRLVKLGNQVTVLTTVPNYPTGIVPKEYRGHLIQSEALDGVRVVRVWCYIAPNKGFFRRILAQFSFGCLAPFLAHKAIGHPDVIIGESPPLFNVIAARTLAWRKHCPLIFWVADLWPESAVQLGVLHNRALIRLSEWLEWSTYECASVVWVVTEGMRDTLIRRGIPLEKLLLITNGVDTAKFRPLPQADARAELGWDERFTVLYAGTHGLAQGLMTVLDAAEQIQDCNDIRFVFVGDGAEKAELVAQAQIRALKNVTFMAPQPHSRMPLLLSGADICLVPLRKLPLFEGALPTKIYETMACARPMLLGVEGEARRLVEQEARAAIYVEPENPTVLVSAILNLHDHPDLAEALGQRGRACVEARFDYDQLTVALDARIAGLLEKKLSASTSATPTPVGAAVEKSQ